LETKAKETKELKKKKTDELSEEEKKYLANLPYLQEVQELTRDVQKAEDLGKKVYGMWDYGYASGIALGVFLLTYCVLGKVIGSFNKET